MKNTICIWLAKAMLSIVNHLSGLKKYFNEITLILTIFRLLKKKELLSTKETLLTPKNTLKLKKLSLLLKEMLKLTVLTTLMLNQN